MKKVLIITYYWPPAGGSGVQRWLKFSKYLPKYGWKPIIFTPENPYTEINDFDLCYDISNDLEIWKAPIWEPYLFKDKLFGKGANVQSSGIILNNNSFKNRLLKWIRGNFFIPDPKIYWVKPSIDFLVKKIKSEGINCIVTTGPPHSMHLIGLGLKKILPDLNWVSDFRDPWSELDILEEFNLSKRTKLKHLKLENQVLKTADLVLTVSKTWLDDLKRLGAKNIELITNGFDAEDFVFEKKDNDKFIIGHFGLLNHLRNPLNFWRTLNDICKKDPMFNNKLEIHLAGNIDNSVLLQIKSFPFLNDKIVDLKYLSHKNVIKHYYKVSVMLLLLFNSKSGIGNYPGKIFEYFALKKPIVAFGPKVSDTKDLINSTKSGIYFSYDDVNLEENLLKVFNNKLSFGVQNTDQFSRDKLTEKLANLLKNF